MKEYLKINAFSLSKKFGNHQVFKDLDFSICTGESLAITGSNGSGKSTLLEIITGIQFPSSGYIEYIQKESPVPQKTIFEHVGFISPRINPYPDLTGLENINFLANSRGLKRINTDELFRRLDIYEHKNKRVRYYSTGMRQRLKFMLAVIHNPWVLILDEVGSNLDKSGKKIIYSSLESYKSEKIIILATNDEAESKLCDKRINLD